MNNKSIYLKAGRESSLQRFHLWVFSGAISHAEEGIEEGDIVSVLTSKGNFVARGYFQHSSIAVRILSFEDTEIDINFWKQRLHHAFLLRQSLGLPDNTDTKMYRLVNGEGDNLSGLIIDCYGETAVMQSHSVGMHRNRRDICEALTEVMGNRIKHVYYKSETTLPLNSGMPFEEKGFLYGQTDENISRENGLQFKIDWLRGQKTGFFIDQRENRNLVKQLAKGKKVLNMFCYTGGFSVYALAGNAALVHSVDSSGKAVELTNENVRINFGDDSRHRAFVKDAFDFLDHAEEDYELMILDPPAFAKHRRDLRNALKGYTRLNAKGMGKLAPGSMLFTFSCSEVVSKEDFQRAIFTASYQAQRQVRIIAQLHQPADHPINIYHPESEYLKGLVLYVE